MYRNTGPGRAAESDACRLSQSTAATCCSVHPRLVYVVDVVAFANSFLELFAFEARNPSFKVIETYRIPLVGEALGVFVGLDWVCVGQGGCGVVVVCDSHGGKTSDIVVLNGNWEGLTNMS